MSEYGEIEHAESSAGLAEAHVESGGEQDYQSQYGILAQEHESFEHEEFENIKHIEYTDAAGNHYEVTEYTRYEHTEYESESTYGAYGSEGGDSGFGAAEGTESLGQVHGAAAIGGAGTELHGLTERFENFLTSAGFLNDNDISDSSA
ncbi:hypothetical protein ABZS66_20475 [Dactylosporangium sp. NPDC005572]|uniref:hypothetical protein n=1 Tax=Dactylosporangium sp. NPDC005572 TaxID=3156889 RepID=UPI0033BDB1D6